MKLKIAAALVAALMALAVLPAGAHDADPDADPAIVAIPGVLPADTPDPDGSGCSVAVDAVHGLLTGERADIGARVDAAFNPAYWTAHAAAYATHKASWVDQDNPTQAELAGASAAAATAGQNAGDDAVDDALGGDGDRATPDDVDHLHRVECPTPPPASPTADRYRIVSGTADPAPGTVGQDGRYFWCPEGLTQTCGVSIDTQRHPWSPVKPVFRDATVSRTSGGFVYRLS